MKIFKTIGRACIIATAMVVMPAYAQDKMVDALPIDQKLRAIDSISIYRLHAREAVGDALLSDLYPSWTNTFERYSDVAMPAEYRIDMRNFCMPCESRVVTSHFGYRSRFRRNHYGTDIKVYVGDTIRAAFSGKVRVVDYEGKGYGKYVIIRHPNGLETLYGHMSKHLVVENQVVRAGDPVGLGGSTGRSTGPHLHFETRFLGHQINPEHLFSFEARDVKGDIYVYRKNGRSGFVKGGSLLAETSTDVDAEVAESQAKKVEESRQFQENRKSRSSRGQVYKVRRGDTLSSIARKYHTTVSRLCKLNNIPKNKTLSPGQIIKCS